MDTTDYTAERNAKAAREEYPNLCAACAAGAYDECTGGPECPTYGEPHDYQPNGRDSAGMTE